MKHYHSNVFLLYGIILQYSNVPIDQKKKKKKEEIWDRNENIIHSRENNKRKG
jgi:hypothetical protein